MKTLKNLYLTAFILSLAAFAGCGVGAQYKEEAVYKSLSLQRSPLGPFTVAVLPAEDKRGNKNQEDTKLGMAQIPIFVPYASITRDRPEMPTPKARNDMASMARFYAQYGGGRAKTGGLIESAMATPGSEGGSSEFPPEQYAKYVWGYPPNFSAPEFLRDSLVKELEHTRMFERVIAVRGPRDLAQADLVLKPTLLSTKAKAWASCYGLGLFWWDPTGLILFLPFPTAGVKQEFAMKLELLEPGSDKAIWSGNIYEKAKGKAHLYYLSGLSKYYGNGARPTVMVVAPGPGDHHGQPLNVFLAKGMEKLTPGLHGFLKKQDPTFWEELQFKKSQRPAPEPEVVPGAPAPTAPTGPSGMQKALEEIQRQLLEE